MKMKTFVVRTVQGGTMYFITQAKNEITAVKNMVNHSSDFKMVNHKNKFTIKVREIKE